MPDPNLTTPPNCIQPMPATCTPLREWRVTISETTNGNPVTLDLVTSADQSPADVLAKLGQILGAFDKVNLDQETVNFFAKLPPIELFFPTL
jgi:hypothetical protein